MDARQTLPLRRVSPSSTRPGPLQSGRAALHHSLLSNGLILHRALEFACQTAAVSTGQGQVRWIAPLSTAPHTRHRRNNPGEPRPRLLTSEHARFGTGKAPAATIGFRPAGNPWARAEAGISSPTLRRVQRSAGGDHEGRSQNGGALIAVTDGMKIAILIAAALLLAILARVLA